jgi:hypothetical protein
MRRLQCCLYLVGPPEDELRLWLRLFLVPGQTCLCPGSDCVPHCPPLGRFLHWGRSGHHHRPSGVGVVLVIKYSSVWVEPDIKHFYINNRRAWVWGGSKSLHFEFKLSLELGAPRAGLRLCPGVCVGRVWTAQWGRPRGQLRRWWSLNGAGF